MQKIRKSFTAVAPGTLSYTAAIKLIRAFLAISLFAGLTYVGSEIRIPLRPVPITLQTLFVLLAGAMIGAMRGSLSQFLYILIGALGAPVFAGHASGLAVLSGPTGGYLLGFIASPIVITLLIGKTRSIAWIAAVFSIGALLILAIGTMHLAIFYTSDLAQALRVGFLPFIPGEILKVLAATSIYRSFKAIAKIRTSRFMGN